MGPIRSRIEAFKRGEYPYGQTPPGAPAELAPSPEEKQRAQLRAQREKRFQESRARATREHQTMIEHHRVLDECGQQLVQVYGPPVGSPAVVECVRQAKALVRNGEMPRFAISRAALRTGAEVGAVLACLQQMRGAV